ncbi:hypothetical protein KC353_g1021 [Hortaea werneckii]|nr:hypothetical protein KC353_g1021 [Hortaea werneckii]
MPYPPPPYGPPGAPQQPPMYNYDLNQPPNRHPIYQQQNPNMMYQHHPPMQGHWQAPQYASSQPPINNVYNIYIGGALQYSSSLQPNITYHFGNVAPPQYAAPPNPVYGPQQQQPAAPPYPQQTYPHMPNQAAPPNYAPIYPTQPMPQQPGYAEYVRSPAYAARPGGAALPDDGRAFARRRRNSSRPGVDQLADAVGRKVFIETPTPSPDSTKATGGVPTDICRFDMTCEEPHDEYFAFLDFCLGIPKNTIKFWKFPSKLFRQTEHGCQDRNGAPCNARQMPMRGIALPYDADNPYGYVTRRPPRWICEQFKPQAD